MTASQVKPGRDQSPPQVRAPAPPLTQTLAGHFCACKVALDTMEMDETRGRLGEACRLAGHTVWKRIVTRRGGKTRHTDVTCRWSGGGGGVGVLSGRTRLSAGLGERR